MVDNTLENREPRFNVIKNLKNREASFDNSTENQENRPDNGQTLGRGVAWN